MIGTCAGFEKETMMAPRSQALRDREKRNTHQPIIEYKSNIPIKFNNSKLTGETTIKLAIAILFFKLLIFQNITMKKIIVATN